jgi:hypothetical protein
LIEDGLKQCEAAGVSAFVKQLGSNAMRDLSHAFDLRKLAIMNQAIERVGGTPMTHEQWDRHIRNCPKQFDHPKGGDPNEWPESFRLRQFPV